MSTSNLVLFALGLATAASNAAMAQSATGNSTSSAEAGEVLAEVMVTAQKRSESVMDVPTSISAIGGERLESLHVGSLADLASYVPGMAVMAGGAPGYRTIVLRGLNTGYYTTTGPLVGTYIDDLPVGGGPRPSLFGLDLNPYDIERIEVLKGPQGTLYGANTMGGLVKYSLRRPDLQEFEAMFGADVQSIDGGSGVGWTTRGAVSMPIVADRLAVRLSAFRKDNLGYIDNDRLGLKDINDSTQTGGMATVLWQVTDDLTIRASLLAQDTDANNMTAVTFDGATLQPLNGKLNSDSQFLEPFEQTTRTYSLAVDWDLGFATVTSSTGWSELKTEQTEDFTVPFGSYCAPGSLSPAWPGCPTYPQPALSPFTLEMEGSRLVEELRLTSPEDQKLQWMIGGYYSKEDISQHQYLPALSASYQPVELLYETLNDWNFDESAAFANLTYSITDRVDVSIGGRYSAYKQRACERQNAGLIGIGPSPCDELPKTDVSLWMANVRFHVSDDVLLYLRAADSYRPGSGCKVHADGTPCGNPVIGVPGIIEPDKTTSYEGGLKGTYFDRRLQLSASAFYIDWSNIQLTQRTPTGFIYPGNGGTASSEGVELTTTFRPIDELQFDATISYTDAHLTEDAPGAGGRSGDPLPGSARWTGSLTADFTRPVGDTTTLLLGASYRYRDGIVNQFPLAAGPAADPAAPIGPQNIVDIYGGLAIADLTLRLYATNVADDQSYAGLFYLNDLQRPKFVPVQPRTLGFSIDYQF